MENSILNRFIENASITHSLKYNYSKVIYKNTNTKVLITCPKHGDFSQIPKNHLRGHGCLKCAQEHKSSLLSDGISKFILKSEKKHGDKYDYSVSSYTNNKAKLSIICKLHGVFKMIPSHHLSGHGCPSCTGNYRRNNTEFIEECTHIHGKKYSYELTDFKSLKRKIIVVCIQHGEFSQLAGHHIIGHGCPICSSSHGERYIKDYLDRKSIAYVREKTFDDCLNKENHNLRFDFYIPSMNLCIEYDGIQHFKPMEYFGGQVEFDKIRLNDSIKNKYCLLNSISLLRIKYLRPSNKNWIKISNILNQKIK